MQILPLPLELRAHVFSNVSKHDLKICRLVSKGWQKDVDDYNGHCIVIDDTQRGNVIFAEKVRITEVKITNLRRRQADRLDLLYNFALKKVTLTNICDAEWFRKKLCNFSHLTSLVLRDNVLHAQNFEPVPQTGEDIIFPRLRYLEIRTLNTVNLTTILQSATPTGRNLVYLFNHLRCPKLEIFSYHNTRTIIPIAFNWTNIPIRTMVSKHANSLREMILDGYVLEYAGQINDVPSNLSKLKLCITVSVSTGNNETPPQGNFWRRVLDEQRSLADLDLSLCDLAWGWTTVSNVILNNAETLTHLSLAIDWPDIENTPVDLALFEDCVNLQKFSLSIHLGLVGGIENLVQAIHPVVARSVNINRLTPNLRKLYLRNVQVLTDDLIKFDQLFPRLQVLSLNRAGCRNSYGVTREVLQTFIHKRDLNALFIFQLNHPIRCSTVTNELAPVRMIQPRALIGLSVGNSAYHENSDNANNNNNNNVQQQ